MPFEQDNPVVKDRLVLLYDSLCLRRTKDILTLPGVEERLRHLDFTPEERNHYEKTLKIVHRSMREKVGQYEQVSKFGLFQAHLQLRILCNHGTYQKPFSWKRSRLRDAQEALNVDLGSDLEVRCAGCEQTRPLMYSKQAFNTESCGHYFCFDCLEDLEEISGPLESMPCPLCSYSHGSIRPQHPDTSEAPAVDGGDAAAAETEQPSRQADESSHGSDYFNEVGVSTKMQALVRDVKQDLGTMKRSVATPSPLPPKSTTIAPNPPPSVLS